MPNSTVELLPFQFHSQKAHIITKLVVFREGPKFLDDLIKDCKQGQFSTPTKSLKQPFGAEQLAVAFDILHAVRKQNDPVPRMNLDGRS